MTQDAIDPQALGWTRASFPGFVTSGFVTLIGPFWHKHSDAGSDWAFLADQRHLNGQDVVHGGMLMSFIDQALGVAVSRATEGKRSATIQLDSQFVDGGREGDLVVARTMLTRRTRAIIFMQGTLHAGERTLMTAQGIWKVLGA